MTLNELVGGPLTLGIGYGAYRGGSKLARMGVFGGRARGAAERHEKRRSEERARNSKRFRNEGPLGAVLRHPIRSGAVTGALALGLRGGGPDEAVVGGIVGAQLGAAAASGGYYGARGLVKFMRRHRSQKP